MKKIAVQQPSSVPNVDTLLTAATTSKKKKKSSVPLSPPSQEVKSVTPTKKKKSIISPPEEVKKASPPPKKKPKKKQFIEDIPQEITKSKPIVENKSLGIDNINIIVDSIENVSILDIISSSENPDMTTMFNNLLAIS